MTNSLRLSRPRSEAQSSNSERERTINMDPTEEIPLPTGFTTIEKIRNLSNGEINAGSLVSVIGVLKDLQSPTYTRGTDAKCTLGIVDHSMQDDTHELKVSIFWPMEKMPRNMHNSDLVLIRKAKVQMYRGFLSLLASFRSEFHILRAGDVPKSQPAMGAARWTSYPNKSGAPKIPETQYAAWLHSKTADLDLPSDTEFNNRVESSTRGNDKFKLLKDLKDIGTSLKTYANLLGQVRRVHDTGSEIMEVYLSDYTENPDFYNYAWGEESEKGNYDEFGYRKQPPRAKVNQWPGPYGKFTIQIALYNPHADYVREEVKVDSWIAINNVRIKTGHYLEGVVHTDDVVKVTVLDTSPESLVANSTNPTNIRLQEAIHRKYLLTKKFEQQTKAISELDAKLGDKRKWDETDKEGGLEQGKKLNSKQRRKLERANAEKKVQEAQLKKLKLQSLNPNIRCQFPEQDPVTIKEILKPLDLGLEGIKVDSPFTNTQYRASVRVVDYFPHNLEDFVVGSRSHEFDHLEDFSGLEDTDTERDRKIWRSGQGHPKDHWEWRFALQVEDAIPDPDGAKERLWLIVDNTNAQMLLNINDDATSLRNNPDVLAQVKEQLFKLWGNLEEQTSLRESAAATLSKSKASNDKFKPSRHPPSSCPPSSPPPRLAGMPDTADSDDEDTNLPSRINQNNNKNKEQENSASKKEKDGSNGTGGSVTDKEKKEEDNKTKNLGFTCCIRQYGVKVKEDNKALANAGDGYRWQRMFGMFGTMID